MILSIIIGTVVCGIALRFLSKFFEIFATPWTWFVSWFVVVAVVFNIGDSMSASKELKALVKEAEKINGAWASSDGNIGIRALTDDGSVKKTYEEDVEGFLAVFYGEDGEESAAVVFDPDKHSVYVRYMSGESETGTYKLKGWISKRLVLDLEESGKTTYKRKSKDWEYYMN